MEALRTRFNSLNLSTPKKNNLLKVLWQLYWIIVNSFIQLKTWKPVFFFLFLEVEVVVREIYTKVCGHDVKIKWKIQSSVDAYPRHPSQKKEKGSRLSGF